ncbi:unnamed protein product [Colias eurytheme]|nr:unnamed protein product [Colias eurytheme]
MADESVADAGGFGLNAENSSHIDEIRRTAPIFNPNDRYYDMSGEKYLYIFNHYMYKKTRYFNNSRPSTREGTQKDVSRLTEVFQNLGFLVTTYNDKEHAEIMEKVADISKKDHKQTSCIFFAFLTHGDSGGELHAADRPYLLKDVLVLLEHGHASLVAKPKVLFVQACRGNKADSGRRVELDSSGVSYVVPTHSDFLVLYSTVEDYLSYRDINGSFMIQDLCDIIVSYHEQWDLLHLVTMLHNRVAHHRSTYSPRRLEHHDKRQMPETRYTLTKLLKF